MDPAALSRTTRHRGAALLALAVALALIGLVVGCETFEVPTWDVDLTIPITSDVHTLDELIEDEENIGVDSLGTLTLAVEQQIERVLIEDELQIDPFSDSASHVLGAIEIATPEPNSTSYIFSQIWPQAGIWDGEYHQVPLFGFTVSNNLPAFSSFQTATLDQAIAVVEVHNGLPVALDWAELTFSNVSDGSIIDVASFQQPVPPGGSAATTLDLAGAAIESRIAVQVVGQAAGSTEPVLIRRLDQFDIELRFLPPVTVSAAVTMVSPQILVRSESIQLGGGAQAGTVEFLDGRLEITVDNTTALDAWITLTLPEFLDALGDTLSATSAVPPGASPMLGFDLSGVTFVPATSGEAQVRATMQLDSGGALVPVAATDAVRTRVNLEEPARVARFTGILEPTSVDLEPTITTLDLPEGLDHIVFAAARMVLELENAAGFPVDLDVDLVGTNALRQTVSVAVERRIAPAVGATPTTTRIVLDRSNSNIVELMNLMPTSIELSGVALIGDGVTPGTVARGDYLEGTATLRAPFEVELLEDRLTIDPDELDIDEDTREIIRDDVSYGSITAEIDNHLPLGATVHLIISHTALGAQDPDGAGNLVLTGIMQAPSIRPDGLVEAAVRSQLTFELDKDDLRIFETAPLYSGVALDLDDSGGRTVRFLATDWVGVQAVAYMRTRVDLD